MGGLAERIEIELYKNTRIEYEYNKSISGLLSIHFTLKLQQRLHLDSSTGTKVSRTDLTLSHNDNKCPPLVKTTETVVIYGN